MSSIRVAQATLEAQTSPRRGKVASIHKKRGEDNYTQARDIQVNIYGERR